MKVTKNEELSIKIVVSSFDVIVMHACHGGAMSYRHHLPKIRYLSTAVANKPRITDEPFSAPKTAKWDKRLLVNFEA